MTNKQKSALVRQMTDRLKKLPDGKKTSVAKLLEQADLSDEEFAFDANDLENLWETLLRQTKRERLTLQIIHTVPGMEYLSEFAVKRN